MRLRGGYSTNDPRLDRVPEFDEQSRSYPIRTLVAEKQPRSYTWRSPLVLDQGQEGACVGFAFAHELAARPALHPWVSNDYARDIYHEAQVLDEWPGEAYEGTSVLAGAKACAARGHFGEYRWAFSFLDWQLALGYSGGGVLGLNWYTGMMRPDADGRIRATGELEGGHAIRGTGIWMPSRREPLGRIWVWNSWGQRNGWPLGWLNFDDAQRLREEAGEFCIPVGRRRVPQV